MRSVETALMPVQKDIIRGVLGPSGFIIEPISPTLSSNQTKTNVKGEKKSAENNQDEPPPPPGVHLTYVAQFDRHSVMIVAPDLLGESSEMYRSIQNISMELKRAANTRRTAVPG